MSYPITPNAAIHQRPPQAGGTTLGLTVLEGLAEQLIQAIFNRILQIITGTLGISSQAEQQLIAEFNTIISDASGAISFLENVFGPIYDSVTGEIITLEKAATGFFNNIATTAGWTGSSATTSVNAIENVIATAGIGSVKILAGDATTVQQFFSAVFTNINNANSAITTLQQAANVLGHVGYLSKSVGDVGSSIENLLKDVTSVLAGAMSTIGYLMEGIGGFIRQFPGGSGVGNTIFNNGASLISQANGLTNNLSAAIAGINSALSTVSTVATTLPAIGTTINNTITQAKNASDAIVDQVITNPSWLGSTNAVATFPIVSVPQTTGSSPTPNTISVTQANSVIGKIGPVTNYNNSSFISTIFVASITGTLTEIFLNLYLYNSSSNTYTYIEGQKLLNTTSGLAIYNPTLGFPIINAGGDTYALEIGVFGAGTLNLVGLNHWTLASGLPPSSIGNTRSMLAYDNSTQAYNFNNAYTSGVGSTLVSPAFTVNAAATCVVAGISYAPSPLGSGYIVAQISGDGGTTWTAMSLAAASGTEAISTTTGGGANSLQQFWVSFTPPTGSNVKVRIVQQVATNWQANLEVASYIGPTAVGEAQYGSGGTSYTMQYTSGVLNSFVLALQLGLASITAQSGTGVTTRQISNVGYTAPSALVEYQGAASVPITNTNTGGGYTLAMSLICPTPTALSSPTVSSNIPWLALSATTGASKWVSISYVQSSHGTYTYSIPAIAQVAGTTFNIVLLGAGGSGGYAGFAGVGGGAGSWYQNGTNYGVTLTYGTDIPLSTTYFTITVGTGGDSVGGNYGPNQNGISGTSSSVQISGYGTLTASGGAGGSGSYVSNTVTPGGSVGSITFGGTTYVGGAGGSSGLGAYGYSPGGGGEAGGYFSVYSTPYYNTYSGAGADGAVWITAVQGPYVPPITPIVGVFDQPQQQPPQLTIATSSSVL